MPIITINIARGRSNEQLRTLMAEVHAAVERAVGAPSASIRVLVNEVEPELWLSGSQTLAEKSAP